MKCISLLLLSSALSTLCAQFDPLRWSGYCWELDRVASIAASQPETRATAVDVLEKIALDRASSISAEAERQVGSAQDELHDGGFHAPEVRACALRAIGGTGLPEALDFLKGLMPDDFATDTTQQIWPAAETALRDATLRGIQDPQLQIEFLEHTATEMAHSGTGIWAFNELCNRGSLGSLVTIQKAIRETWSGHYGEDETAFCEARIRVLYGKPDRAKALGAVLSVETSADNARLTTWALGELRSMHSSAADAELVRFANEIDKLPADSTTKGRLLLFRRGIATTPPSAR